MVIPRSSGFLKTPMFSSSSNLHVSCSSCNWPLEYWNKRPLRCGGCTGPMFTTASNGPTAPLYLLKWGSTNSLKGERNWDTTSLGSWLSGSTSTPSEWMTFLFEGVEGMITEDWVLALVSSIMSVRRIWQKWSCFPSRCGNWVRFGTRTLPLTLVSNMGEIHWSWGVQSVRGSQKNHLTEVSKLNHKLPQTILPTVVGVSGARKTSARQTEWRIELLWAL